MSQRECSRCGNDSLADYDCVECGESAVQLSDEMHHLDSDGLLYETDEDGGSSQITCSDCGKEVFEVSYHNYCGWCQHQVDKDD